MSEPFIGEIKIFAGNFAPRGWANCDGQLLPIANYSSLFSLLGTIYGGDGRTTFALPNLQGRAAMHPGRGPGLTSRRLGERGGVESVSLATAQIPNHQHDWKAVNKPSSTSPSQNYLGFEDANTTIYADSAKTANMNAATVESSGLGQGHNNMQPYIAMKYIIALVGLYPSRS